MQKNNTLNINNLILVFGNFAVEVFNYKKHILNNDSQFDFKTIHKNLSKILKDILDIQKSISFEKKVREVVYIMASLADEVFLNISWEGKDYWENNMLEKHFFGTQIAGEKFFLIYRN